MSDESSGRTTLPPGRAETLRALSSQEETSHRQVRPSRSAAKAAQGPSAPPGMVVAQQNGVAKRPASDVALHVLVVPKSHAFLARCLEYDVMAQGKTAKEATEYAIGTLTAYVERNRRAQREPFDSLERASEEHWERFASGRPKRVAVKATLPGNLGARAEVRVAVK